MTDDPIPDRQEVLAKSSDATLVDALFTEYGRIWLDADNKTVDLLADMHNAGEIDLLSILTPEAVARHQGHGFFKGQHLYEKLIPRLSASVREMLCAVETLRVGGGDDLGAGLHVDKFAAWCGDDPARPYELLKLIDEGVAAAENYLIIAIKAGVLIDRTLFTDRAYSFLSGGNERHRLNALSALSQIHIYDSAEWDRLLSALSVAYAANDNDPFRGQLISSVAKRLKDAPAVQVPALEHIISSAVIREGDQTLHAAASILAFGETSLGQNLKQEILDALSGIKSVNNRTVGLLDIALSNMIQAGNSERVQAYVKDLVMRDDDPIRLGKLGSMISKLKENSEQVFEDWVVAWLRDGSYRLCSAMDRTMFSSGTAERAFRIDFSKYDLADAEYPYLARKVVGSFFLKPLVMTSLLASLLRSAPPNVVGDVEEVLVDPVLKSYVGSTRDHLTPIADDVSDPASTAVQRVLAIQSQYLEGLDAVGTVRELRPSERERQLEWERHSDSMADAMRQARKKSIFAQIVSESVILYGNRAVSWIDRSDEEPRRLETELGSIRTSIEVPRIDVVDPVGLQMQLLSFRAEERPA